MKVRDLWEHADNGIFTDNYGVNVPIGTDCKSVPSEI